MLSHLGGQAGVRWDALVQSSRDYIHRLVDVALNRHPDLPLLESEQLVRRVARRAIRRGGGLQYRSNWNEAAFQLRNLRRRRKSKGKAPSSSKRRP